MVEVRHLMDPHPRSQGAPVSPVGRVSAPDGAAPVALALVLVSLAWAAGLVTTRGVEWPGVNMRGVGIDIYRDIALAQTMLDSGYGPDAAYVGERTWYNPLAPALTALVSAMTGWPVPFVAARIGAYANLIAPLSFFALCAFVLGRWTALWATAGFLFLTSSTLPSWVSATYSPWFMPVNFVQGAFYLTVLALVWARRSDRLGRFVWPGVLWGLTFLGHTAPALIIGIMVLWLSVRDSFAGRSTVGGAASRTVVMMSFAIAVSSPLIVIIVGHYGLRTAHTQPSLYSEPLLARELPTLLRMHLTLPMAVAVVGAWAVWRRRAVSAEARVWLGAWILAAASLLGYGYVVIGARLAAGIDLPSVVPFFHFFFYLKAATAVLFGIGVDQVGQWAGARFGRSTRMASAAACAVLLAAGARAYVNRPDFADSRRDALAVTNSDQASASRWLRAQAAPGDVALATDLDAALVAGPAGVKVVATFGGFSNPYVPREPRVAARDGMLAAIDRGDAETFMVLARPYSVSWVVVSRPRPAAPSPAMGGVLEPQFETGSIAVYRVKK